MRTFAAPVLALVIVGAAAPAGAFTVTVDGSADDWTLAAPAVSNLGHLGRDAMGRGAWIWTDAGGDERTDFGAGGPDPRVDLTLAAITSDATSLYFLFRMSNIDVATGDGAPQVQIAIDLDRVSGSGNPFFRGLADTDVAADAEWEFLVQTRFGSGGPSPAVWNAAGTNVASGASQSASSGPGGTIEVAVPWANLGLGAGPTAPLRFSIATFRSNPTDDTFDVAGQPDALDAVTLYANPGSGAAPNTFADVSDGILDHHFEIWFHLDPDREPSAPVLISEIGYQTPGIETDEEWIELFNATGASIDLASWRIGDEETPDGPEGLFRLPAGIVAGAGATVLVGVKATGFRGLFGIDPDVEITNTVMAVPDSPREMTWASGAIWQLANAGDEVLLVDRFFTVVDVVSYEMAPPYPGLSPHPTNVMAGQTIRRSPARRDTNTGAVDFTVGTTPDPGAGTGLCLDAAGTPLAAGAACDDRDACTTGACDGAGACGAPRVCSDDGNECTVDTCDRATGICGRPASAGAACTDTVAGDCNDARCNGSGTCVQDAGPEPAGTVCRASAGACDVAEACDGVAAGACPSDARASAVVECRAAAGTCDVAETCDGTGVDCPADAIAPAGAPCRPGAGICDLAELCDGASAACPMDVFAPAGMECRAAAGICDVAETCTGTEGTCPVDGFAPSSMICRGSTGGCDPDERCAGSADCPADVIAAAGTECRGALGPCDLAEVCDGAATSCPVDGFAPPGTTCDDGDPCTTDACDATGACLAEMFVCDAGPPDAGPPDGGPMPEDAGVDVDAGPAIDEDAGPEADAGPDEDAGPRRDAGTGIDAGRVPTHVSGGGGCSVGDRAGSSVVTVLLVCVALLLGRIRRRRTRR